MNLLYDTYEALHRRGKKLSDIEWIGCEDFQIAMDNFLECADVEYDNDARAVAEDLMLVGHNFMLYRDPGSPRWLYFELPSPPLNFYTVESLIKTEKSEARRWNDDSDWLYKHSLKNMTKEQLI